MSKPKPYAILRLTEPQFERVRAALLAQRKLALDNWKASTDEAEKAFYVDLMRQYDGVLVLCDDVLIADKSQDAEPDDDDEEVEPDDDED